MIERSNYSQENQPRHVSDGEAFPVQGTIYFSPKKEKDLRHNKNLHGEGRYVDGLTGFYHRKYYRGGRHQPPKQSK